MLSWLGARLLRGRHVLVILPVNKHRPQGKLRSGLVQQRTPSQLQSAREPAASLGPPSAARGALSVSGYLQKSSLNAPTLPDHSLTGAAG